MKLLVALTICAVCVSGESLKRNKRGWGYETTTEKQGWGWTTQPPPPPPPPPTQGWKQPQPTQGWGQQPQPTQGWGWSPPQPTPGWGWGGGQRYNDYYNTIYGGGGSRYPRPYPQSRYPDSRRYGRDSYRDPFGSVRSPYGGRRSYLL